MTASSIPQRTKTQQAFPNLKYLARCCFCSQEVHSNTLFCERCARVWWEQLRMIDATLPAYDSLQSLPAVARKPRPPRPPRKPARVKAPKSSPFLIAQTSPAVPLALVQDRRIGQSPTILRVYALLVARGADRGFVQTHYRRMASELGIAQATVWRAVDLLINLGYLEHRGRYGVRVKERKA